MKIKIIVICAFFWLLVACSSANTTPLPPASHVSPTQNSVPSLTSPAESNPELERLVQVGGSINGITMVGDLAYVGMGPRVAVIDISHDNNPRLVKQSEPLPGLVTHLLQVSGGSAPGLVVNAGKYLVLADISNPEQILPIHQLELPGPITAIVWDDKGNILYAGGSIYQDPSKYTGFISAVSIAPDNEFKLINTVTIPEMVFSIALGEKSIYAGANGDEGGLYRIQLNTPGELSAAHQVLPSTPEIPLVPTSMQVIGERLYLGYWGVEAFDITNNGQPVKIWSGSSPELNIVTGFTMDGNRVFITGFSIREPDIQVVAAFTAPEPIMGSRVGKVATNTVIHNGDFIVADRSLKIFRATGEQNLQLVDSYLPPVANPTHAVANEKAVFVVDIGVGDGLSNAVMWVLSLPDLKPIGQVTTEIPASLWQGLNGIALDGDRVYLAATDKVWVYEVGSAEPTLVGTIEITDGKIETIAASKSGKKRLLVVAQDGPNYSSVLTVYDGTDLQKPAKLDNPLPLDQGSTKQIIWNGSALNLLLDTSYHSDSDILYLVEIDNNGLRLRDSIKIPGYTACMAVDDKVISLADLYHLSIVSPDQAEPSKQLAQVVLPRPGMGLAIINNKALVVVGDEQSELYGAAQLLTFDIQDLSNIKLIEAMDIAFSDNQMVPILETEPYVILVNGLGGVEVLGYDQ